MWICGGGVGERECEGACMYGDGAVLMVRDRECTGLGAVLVRERGGGVWGDRVGVCVGVSSVGQWEAALSHASALHTNNYM